MRNLNIIFLHGWLFDSKVWCGISNYFHAEYSVKMYDLPGYGKNKTLKLDHQTFCDRIFLDIDRPTIVIGWSYGGLLALKSYLSINSNIKKIFLINTNLNIMGKNNTILNQENITQLKINLKLHRKKTIQKFMYEVLRHSKYLKQELIMLNKIYNDSCWPSNNELIKNLEYMETFQHNIENIQRDVILINSENDIFNDMEYLERLDNKFIQKKTVKDAGHLPFISRNKEIYSLIENLI